MNTDMRINTTPLNRRTGATENVAEVLGQSKASCHRDVTLPGGLKLAYWSNTQDRVNYHNPNHHTLSLYAKGAGVRLFDGIKGKQTGMAGDICVLPLGHDSQWEINSHVEFLHFYFEDVSLRQLAVSAFDLDPRTISLPDLTYTKDPQLLVLMRNLMMVQNWHGDDVMGLQEAGEGLLAYLLQYHLNMGTPASYKGGLTTSAVKRVREYIDTFLGERITLEDMAEVAQLSTFHFSRMFKVSTAYTPHEMLTQSRIARAKAMLRARGPNEPLAMADLAKICGFTNQSHFSRTFKQHVGVSPKRYQLLASG